MSTLRNFGRIGWFAGLSVWRFFIWVMWLVFERLMDLWFIFLVVRGVTLGIARAMRELFWIDRERFFIIIGFVLLIVFWFWVLWLSW